MQRQNDDELEFNAAGAESEDDVSAGLSLQVSRAVLWATDWTIETLYGQLKKGNIELNPEFQRREAWNDTKKSRFIESVLLGFPIPQIVLAERKGKTGAYIVIDGKQRLLSIRRFCASNTDADFRPFALTGLNIRTELNGLTFDEVKATPSLADEVRSFENQTIRTTIIRNWPSENFLYTVFHRLNTGSVPLSPQELRQALHPGPFLTFADSFTQKSEAIPALLGRTTPDFRMRDIELFVRFFAFRFFLEEYKGNLKQFLDDACESLNANWPQRQSELEGAAQKLEHAIQLTFRVFGEDKGFRKWTSDGYERRFNRAVFDVMVFYFADLKTVAVTPHAKAVRAAFEKLCVGDADFLRAIETTTKSLSATGTRLELWGKELRRILGGRLKVARLAGRKLEKS